MHRGRGQHVIGLADPVCTLDGDLAGADFLCRTLLHRERVVFTVGSLYDKRAADDVLAQRACLLFLTVPLFIANLSGSDADGAFPGAQVDRSPGSAVVGIAAW